MAKLKTMRQRMAEGTMPPPVEFKTPEECIAAYESGFEGAIYDPEGGEEVEAQEDGVFADAAHKYGFAGSGKGKLILAYTACWDVSGRDDWYHGYISQPTGDCFVAGTKVTMTDGTLKSIEDVQAGEEVLTPQGNTRRVLDTFSKKYRGDLHTIRCRGGLDIQCTPDHKFLSPVNDYENTWIPAALIEGKARLLRPYAEPSVRNHVFDLTEYGSLTADQVGDRNVKPAPGCVRMFRSKEDCPRYITLDSDFAWFLGLFMAEGGVDKSPGGSAYRVRFNLCHTETHLSDRVLEFCERLGVTARKRSVPSKPTVHYAEVANNSVAELVHRLVKTGSTYTKQVPDQIFSASREIRRSFLHGWMAGDGHFRLDERKDCKALQASSVGVSVNFDLLNGMSRVARSLGIYASTVVRPARKQSKQAYALHSYGGDAFALAGEKASCAIASGPKQHRKTSLGFSSPLDYNKSEPWDGTVYCIEVEEDHAFIANGYAVHNCVSRGQSHAAILSLANAVQNGNGSWPDIPEFAYKSGMPFHPTPTYWEKKGGQSGWSCSSAAARSKDKTGLVLAISYPENPKIGDLLLKYNTSVITKYCKTGAPQDVIDTLNKHCTLTYSRTNTSKKEEIMDAIANGYGVQGCGGQGYGKGSSARNKETGYCKRSGSWSHALCIIGYDDTEWAHKTYGDTLFLVLNSWGAYLGSDRPHPQANPAYPGIPKGSFWCTASSFSGRDSYAISSVSGYPPQKLKDWSLRDLI